MELARVDVRETASQVFVTVLARWEPPTDEAAATTPTASSGRKREATASLRNPLGDRALVHAPHDTPPRTSRNSSPIAPRDAPPHPPR